MCIYNPIPFRSDEPVVAYKSMKFLLLPMFVQSWVAKNVYELGKEYVADAPLDSPAVVRSTEYSVGFHAYESLDDAKNASMGGPPSVVVRVELSDLTFKGYENNSVVLIANKCKFLEIVPMES